VHSYGPARVNIPCDIRDACRLTRHLVGHRVGLVVGSVDGADQHVVGDVVQMTAVLEPRAAEK
jgi:hypothetical protein